MVNQSQAQFPPPPEITTPDAMPWDQLKALNANLMQLVTLMQQQMTSAQQIVTGTSSQFTPPSITVLPSAFGAPGSTQQLINVMLEQTDGALGSGGILPFKKTVPSEYQDEQDRLIVYHSVLYGLLISFPAGCQNLVETRLIYYPKDGSREYIFPTIDDEFIGLDDAFALITMSTPLRAPGKLRFEWWNYDTLNSHEVAAIAFTKPTRLISNR